LTQQGHAARAYALTGSQALTYDECAAILAEATGRPIRYTRPSGREFAARMRELGHPEQFITVMRGIYLVARLRMAATVTSELRDLIGREPIGFDRFARDHAALFSGRAA